MKQEIIVRQIESSLRAQNFADALYSTRQLAAQRGQLAGGLGHAELVGLSTNEMVRVANRCVLEGNFGVAVQIMSELVRRVAV